MNEAIEKSDKVLNRKRREIAPQITYKKTFYE